MGNDLKHFGILGMHWGRRKEKKEKSINKVVSRLSKKPLRTLKAENTKKRGIGFVKEFLVLYGAGSLADMLYRIYKYKKMQK